jgi:hypothetical protein
MNKAEPTSTIRRIKGIVTKLTVSTCDVDEIPDDLR